MMDVSALRKASEQKYFLYLDSTAWGTHFHEQKHLSYRGV